MLTTVAAIAGLIVVALAALVPLFLSLRLGEFVLNHLNLGRGFRFLLIPLKSLRRNPARTSLTYLATFVLIAVVTIVWSALYVLDRFMEGKAKDIKLVASERWQAVSLLPFAYAETLCQGAVSRPADTRPQDAMTWQFYVGTIDPTKKAQDSTVVFIALEPRKAPTLMDRILDDVPQQSKQQTGQKLAQAKEFLAAVEKMEKDQRGVVIGSKQLAKLNKRVGERMTFTGINFKDLDLEVEIVGTFPEGRYNESAIMNRDYLNHALDVYPKTHGGQKHPLADRSLGLVILQVADADSGQRVTQQIENSPSFRDPAVKCETLSAYAITQLDSFRDIMWCMRWLLSPAILVTMGLITANSISISVRQRQTEIAVLKVLGYRPLLILILLLGEAMLLGALGGLLSAGLVYESVNRLLDNTDSIIPLYIPETAFVWGPAVGMVTALAGSLVPVWNGCKIRVSTVFTRVA